MVKAKYLSLLFILICAAPLCSYGEIIPTRTNDPHIFTAVYNANQVYRVFGLQGYTTAIELGDDEKILSVNIGDSSAWLVNVQNNVINVKPTTDNPDTNMNVITDRGTYQFLLSAPSITTAVSRQPQRNTMFLLHFTYPDNSSSSTLNNNLIPPGHFNLQYTARGDNSITPICVFDDGHFTYFDFGNRKTIPAIFTVDSKGNESLINYHMSGRYVVVESVGQQFTLRDGTVVASIFNEATS